MSFGGGWSPYRSITSTIKDELYEPPPPAPDLPQPTVDRIRALQQYRTPQLTPLPVFGEYAPVNTPDVQYELPRAFRPPPTGENKLAALTGAPYRIARTAIPEPIRKPVVKVVEEGLRRGSPVGDVDTALNLVERATGRDIPDISHATADLIVPREVWDTALTLIPAAKARTIPELLSAITIGDVDALRAVKQVMPKLADNEIVAGAKQALAGGESGALKLPFGRKAESAVESAARPALEAGTPPTPPTIADSVDAFMGAIRRAEALSEEQRVAQGIERSRRVGGAMNVLEGGGTMREAKGLLKGEYPTISLQKPQVLPEHVALIDDYVERGAWTPVGKPLFPRVDASDALLKLQAGIIPQDSELNALKMMFNSVRPKLGDEFMQIVRAKRPLRQKILDEFMGVLGLPQTFKSAFDLGGIFRQMGEGGPANPGAWVRSVSTLRQVATKVGADQIENETRGMRWINGTWTAKDADKVGYEFEAVGGHLSSLDAVLDPASREGKFEGLNQSWVSRQAQKFPGIKFSEQTYIAPLNRMRAELYSDWAEKMWQTGVRDIEQYKALAKVVNHSTGWGDFTTGGIWKGLNAFFAPRNLVARFQVIFDPFVQPGSLLKPSARQLAAKNLVSFASYNAAILAALKYTGIADVELDPRSADWGKARIGGTTLDFTAGIAPILRTVARLQQGETKTLAGLVKPIDRDQVALDFLRGRFGPIPGFVWDMLEGRNVVGEKVDLRSRKGISKELFDLMGPFISTDVYEAIKESGPVGALTAIPSAVGIGVGTYGPSEDQVKDAAREPARKLIESKGYNQIDEKVFARLQAQGLFPKDAKDYQAYRDGLIEEIGKRLEARGMNPELASVIVDRVPAVKTYTDLVEEVRKRLREADPELNAALLEAGERDPGLADLVGATP